MEHTKGPWIKEPGADDAVCVVSDDDNANQDESGAPCVIAVCQGGDKEANARLIASAPELLEALKSEHDPGALGHGFCADCKTCMVIAKAEGRQ